MRKKTHAFKAREKPKHREMNSNFAGSAARCVGWPCLCAVFMTFIPPSAKRI